MTSEKPPKINIDNYEHWRLMMTSWEETTDIVNTKWAHLVILHCLDQKLQEEVYSNIPAATLKLDTGLTEVYKVLDKKYAVKDSIKQYIVFDNFVEFKKDEETSMLNYTEEFERRVARLRNLKCELPDPVLAHTLVKNSGISDSEKSTLKATCPNLTYAEVKDAIVRIYSNTFGDNDAGSNHDNQTKKEEDLYYTKNEYRDNSKYRSRGRGRGNYERRSYGRGNYGRGSYGRGGSYYSQSKEPRERRDNGKNPIDPKTGKPYLCFNCDSDDHMLRECPHPDRRRRSSFGKGTRFREQPTYYTDTDDNEESYYTESKDENDQEIGINLLELANEENL